MGGSISALLNQFQTRQKRVFVLGLEGAGKTTIMYKLLKEQGLDESYVPISIEQYNYKNLQLTTFDVGGQDKIWPLIQAAINKSFAIIFVIDSTNLELIEMARVELDKILFDVQLKKLPLLILSNKSDQNLISTETIAKKLCLENMSDRLWHIERSCALTGEGLFEGIKWVQQTITTLKQ